MRRRFYDVLLAQITIERIELGAYRMIVLQRQVRRNDQSIGSSDGHMRQLIQAQIHDMRLLKRQGCGTVQDDPMVCGVIA